jgi:hypothetical protein
MMDSSELLKEPRPMTRSARHIWLLSWPVIVVGCLMGSAGAENQQARRKNRYEIAYATYLGGDHWDQAREVIPYPDGTVLVGGMTSSSNMPTTPGVVQPEYAGDDPSLGHGGIIGGDAFLVRLGSDGTRILAATYFGGSKQERGVYGVLLDSEGNIVIGSATRSADMPTTEGAYQTKYGGGQADMYAAKLSADMKKILWCTYVGGSKNDWPRGGLALDGWDNVYIVGGADSKDFPTTKSAFQRKLNGERNAAIVKLSADGSRLVFSTLLGGSVWDGIMGVRVDASGDVYVAGHTRSPDFPVTPGAPQSTLGGKSDCFLAKLSKDGSRLVYSTYLGGAENEFAEHRPLLGRDGTFFLTGVTSSPDFPTTAGALQRVVKGNNDGFITELSSDGKTLSFSSLLGGSGGEFFLMPTLDDGGNMFVVGHTTSSDFPTTRDGLQTAYCKTERARDGDGVLAVLSPDGSKLVYATFLGGSGDDLIRSCAIGPNGEVYLVGSTSSRDFPVTSDAVQTQLAGSADAFVVKLVPVQW